MNCAIKNEITIIFIAFCIKFVFVADPIDENEVEICKQKLLIFSPEGDALTYLDNYLTLSEHPYNDSVPYEKNYREYVASKIIFKSRFEFVWGDILEVITQDYIMQPIIFCRHYIINTHMRAKINEYGQLLRPSNNPNVAATLINIDYNYPENVLLDIDPIRQNVLRKRRKNCVRTLEHFRLIFGMHGKEIFYTFLRNFLFVGVGRSWKTLKAYGIHVKNSSRKLATDTMNVQEYCSSQPEVTEFTIRTKEVIKNESENYGNGIKKEYYTLSQNQVVQQIFQFPEQQVVQQTLQVPEQVVYDTFQVSEQQVVQQTLQVPEQVVHDTFYVPTRHSYDTQPQNYNNFTTGGAGPSNQ